MLTITYKSKDWNKRILTYTDNEEAELIWLDLKDIIKEWATDIRIN